MLATNVGIPTIDYTNNAHQKPKIHFSTRQVLTSSKSSTTKVLSVSGVEIVIKTSPSMFDSLISYVIRSHTIFDPPTVAQGLPQTLSENS